MKKIFIGTLVILLLVTGCGKIPKLKNGQEAIISMKGENISVDDFYNDLKDSYGLNVLITKIDTKILNDLFKESDDEKDYINNQMESIKYAYESYYKSSYSSFAEYLTANGVKDENELKQNISLNYKRQKAIERYVKTLITDKEISKYYEENIFGDISASHILIKPVVKDDASDEEKAEAEDNALKKAKEVITKLKNGEKFEDLAKQYSDDKANSSSGGKLADFNHGQMVEEFEKAARDLKVKTYTTTPVKTEFGYHIIYKSAQKEKPKLEDVKNDIIDDLVDQKTKDNEKLSIKALVELRKEYKVKIQDSELNKQYDAYVKKNS